MSAPIIVIPGAWTLAAAFEDVRDALEAGGHPTQILELPARKSRIAQLDRGGLGAIDRALDEMIGAQSEPPVLMGHSLGGLVALRAARRHTTAALVLLMPAPPSGLLSTIITDVVRHPRNTLRLIGAATSVTLGARLGIPPPDGLYSSALTPEVLTRAADYHVDESLAVLAALAIGSRGPVTPVGVPTLITAGSQDRITPIRVLRPLAEALKAELQEFDVAHAFNEEATYPVVTDAVLEFLSRPR